MALRGECLRSPGFRSHYFREAARNNVAVQNEVWLNSEEKLQSQGLCVCVCVHVYLCVCVRCRLGNRLQGFTHLQFTCQQGHCPFPWKNTDGEENTESTNVIHILQICSEKKNKTQRKKNAPLWRFSFLKQRIFCRRPPPFLLSCSPDQSLHWKRWEKNNCPHLFFQFSQAHLPTSTVYQQGSSLLSRWFLTKDRSHLGKKASCSAFISDSKPASRPERLRRWKAGTEGGGYLFWNRLFWEKWRTADQKNHCRSIIHVDTEHISETPEYAVCSTKVPRAATTFTKW